MADELVRLQCAENRLAGWLFETALGCHASAVSRAAAALGAAHIPLFAAWRSSGVLPPMSCRALRRQYGRFVIMMGICREREWAWFSASASAVWREYRGRALRPCRVREAWLVGRSSWLLRFDVRGFWGLRRLGGVCPMAADGPRGTKSSGKCCLCGRAASKHWEHLVRECGAVTGVANAAELRPLAAARGDARLDVPVSGTSGFCARHPDGRDKLASWNRGPLHDAAAESILLCNIHR